MAFHRLTKTSTAILSAALTIALEIEADALLLLLDGAADWKRLRGTLDHPTLKVIIAADRNEDLVGASDEGFHTLVLNKEKAPLLERLQHALLEAAADEFIKPNGNLIVVYSGFQHGRLDCISHLQLDERLADCLRVISNAWKVRCR